MTHNIYLYLLVMAAVTYAIRVAPMTLLRKPITSPFIRSFLYYVPYVTLAVMTFPAMVNATQTLLSGVAALIVGVAVAWFGGGLFPVAAACCVTVYALELFV